MEEDDSLSDHHDPALEKKEQGQELYLFLFLTIVLAPVITVSLVGGYGLFVWITQIIGGPPTH